LFSSAVLNSSGKRAKTLVSMIFGGANSMA
jgi:hypothetical protein